jgi:hypothetical protein
VGNGSLRSKLVSAMSRSASAKFARASFKVLPQDTVSRKVEDFPQADTLCPFVGQHHRFLSSGRLTDAEVSSAGLILQFALTNSHFAIIFNM